MFENRPHCPTVRHLNPLGLYDPTPNGYSHVAVATLPGRLIFVAGQGGETADGALSPDFQAQLRQAMTNLQIALQGAGAELSDVARLTVLVVDHDADRHAALRAEVLRLWGSRSAPACTLVPVPRLALDGMLIEVEATAVLSR